MTHEGTEYRRHADSGNVYVLTRDRFGRIIGAGGPLTLRDVALYHPKSYRTSPNDAAWADAQTWSNLTTDEIRTAARALIVAEAQDPERVRRAMQELPLAGDLPPLPVVRFRGLPGDGGA